MTAKYFAILTNYGAAQLANAVALGTQMNISAMAVGDGGGTLPVPDPAQTKLVRETRRAAVNQLSIDEKNPNFIIAEQVIPENEGGWWIREIGLFDDTGGLIAVGNAPETYKPNLQEGSGRTQVIQMVLMVSSTQAITLKVDPSVVLATREYVTKSIDAAIQASEARAAKTYQPIGDYVTNPYLKLELLKKIDKADITQQLGNDTGKVVSQNLLTTELGKKASVADANSKLAKDQNGADIPNKDTFIKNLGLGGAAKSNVTQTTGTSTTNVMSQDAVTKLADTKFDKTGGTITTASRAINIVTMPAGAGYIQISDENGNAIHQIGKLGEGSNLSIKNISENASLTVTSGGISLNGKLVALTNALLGINQNWVDVKSQRNANTTYVNSTGKPIYVSIGKGSSEGEPGGLLINGVQVGVLTGSGPAMATSAIVPPGSSYKYTSSNFMFWSELS
ncbi:phage tail protein [Morganella morganii]|uniref:phage tail protein n=1 Tax=Morganella morganii TaxID=582 RepID=UPI003B230B74